VVKHDTPKLPFNHFFIIITPNFHSHGNSNLQKEFRLLDNYSSIYKSKVDFIFNEESKNWLNVE